MEKINIEKIMEEIRLEINNEEYPEDIIEFNKIEYNKELEDYLQLEELKFNHKSLESELIYLKNHKEVQFFRSYETKGISCKIKSFIKKVMRKLSKSFILPIVIEQNNVNQAIYNALCQTNSKFREDEVKIKDLEGRIKELEKLLMEKK